MDQRQTTPPPDPDSAAPGWDGGGWDWQGEFRQPPPHWPRAPLPDLSTLLGLVDALRRMVPPELQEQFAALQRELLLTVRALIDWYLERLEQRSRPVQVEDIPID